MVTITCLACKATNEVQDQVTAYRCSNCQQLWHCVRCTKCSTVLWVKDEFTIYHCLNCETTFQADWGGHSNPKGLIRSDPVGFVGFILLVLFILGAAFSLIVLIPGSNDQNTPSSNTQNGQQTARPMDREFTLRLLRCQELRNIPSGLMTEDDRIEMKEACKGIK